LLLLFGPVRREGMSGETREECLARLNESKEDI